MNSAIVTRLGVVLIIGGHVFGANISSAQTIEHNPPTRIRAKRALRLAFETRHIAPATVVEVRFRSGTTEGRYRRSGMFKEGATTHSATVAHIHVVEGFVDYYALAFDPKQPKIALAQLGSAKSPLRVRVDPAGFYLPNMQSSSYKLWEGVYLSRFRILVILALILGYVLARRRARAVGLDERVMGQGIILIECGGIAMAHLFSALFYFPEKVLADPWYLLDFFGDMSSMGGFLGGALCCTLFFRRKKVSAMKYGEAIMFGLVPSWAVGRLACTLVFDHPGTPTNFPLGMFHKGMGVVHNLGFYEMLLAVALTLMLFLLRRKYLFPGFYFAVVLLAYAPIRFYFDTLRIADLRYWGFTAAQYAALAMVVLGVMLPIRGLKLRRRDISQPIF
jgi:phosphatidylglycerol---prolipoprotein diacylglyceryl transferase